MALLRLHLRPAVGPSALATATLLVVSGALPVVPGGVPGAGALSAPRIGAEAAASASFDSLASEAKAAREAGRLDEAVELYGKALRANPSWLEGRWTLGTILYEQDRFREAEEQFGVVLAAHPDDGQTLALRGLCRARLDNHAEALSDLMAARAAGIPNPGVRAVTEFQAALLLNRLGDPDGAFEVLRPFATNGDDRPAVIEAFGLATLRLPLLPADVPAEKREMVLLAGRGGYHLARARRSAVGRLALEELVSRHPGEPGVHYALAMYLLQDDPARAIDELRRELAVSPDHHVAMIQIALSELKRGRGEDALPVAERAAALAPTVPAARLALGRALLAVGRAEDAVPEMEAAVKLAPENPRLHFALAQAYQRAGRDEDAARARKDFLRLENSAPGDRPGDPKDDDYEDTASISRNPKPAKGEK